MQMGDDEWAALPYVVFLPFVKHTYSKRGQNASLKTRFLQLISNSECTFLLKERLSTNMTHKSGNKTGF